MTKAKQLILPISYPDSGRWYAPVRKIKSTNGRTP